MSEVLGLQANRECGSVDKLSSVRTSTVEVLITPGCRMVGRSLGQLRLRRRYGVYPLAVHRRNQNIGRQLDDLVVQVGDTLLLEGRRRTSSGWPRHGHGRGRRSRRSAPSAAATRPSSSAVLAADRGLSALNVAPIIVLAFVGVAVVLLTRCIDADEAFGFIDGRLLALIFGMLAWARGWRPRAR
jgi:di/tricarboxylate transporter